MCFLLRLPLNAQVEESGELEAEFGQEHSVLHTHMKIVKEKIRKLQFRQILVIQEMPMFEEKMVRFFFGLEDKHC